MSEEKKVPLTSVQVLNSIIDSLTEVFPHRRVDFPEVGIPAYSWDGAGSERGGASDQIEYGRLVLLKGEKEVRLITVGNREERSSKGYAVLHVASLSPNFGEYLLERMKERKEGEENDRHAWRAMDSLLEPGTRNFRGIPLIANDYRGRMQVGFSTKYGIILESFNGLRPIEDRYWNVYLKGEDGSEGEARIKRGIYAYVKRDAVPQEVIKYLGRHEKDILKLERRDENKVLEHIIKLR